MKRVVITGATGEIGIALMHLLVQKEIEVLAICRPHSKRLKYVPNSDYIQIIECDLSELCTLSVAKKKYDVFFHFGWCASYGAKRDNIHLQYNNVKYELDAVELATRLQCRLFIGAGTQAEYGAKDEPFTPRMMAMPKTAYGVGKLCAGHFSRLACKEAGIIHIWVRIASVYGPCDGPYTLITYIMNQLKTQEDILVTSCEQLWDYLYVKDAARAFYLIGEKVSESKIYCLGSGKARALKEYMEEVQIFAQDMGLTTKVRLGAKPYRRDELMFLCADTKELQKDIDFYPIFSFRQGLEETYKWKCMCGDD